MWAGAARVVVGVVVGVVAVVLAGCGAPNDGDGTTDGDADAAGSSDDGHESADNGTDDGGGSLFDGLSAPVEASPAPSLSGWETSREPREDGQSVIVVQLTDPDGRVLDPIEDSRTDDPLTSRVLACERGDDWPYGQSECVSGASFVGEAGSGEAGPGEADLPLPDAGTWILAAATAPHKGWMMVEPDADARTFELAEGETLRVQARLWPNDEPRPGRTLQFALTTEEGWGYEADIQVPVDAESDLIIDNSPPGRGELLLSVRSPPHGGLTNVDEGRRAPAQPADLAVVWEDGLGSVDEECPPDDCDHEAEFSLYGDGAEGDMFCVESEAGLVCALPGFGLGERSVWRQDKVDHSDIDRYAMIGQGDEDRVIDMAESLNEDGPGIRFTFSEAGENCVVTLWPDDSVTLDDDATCEIAPLGD